MDVVKTVTAVVSAIDPPHRHGRQRVVVVGVRFPQSLAHGQPVGHFALAAAALGLDDAVQQDDLQWRTVQLLGRQFFHFFFFPQLELKIYRTSSTGSNPFGYLGFENVRIVTRRVTDLRINISRENRLFIVVFFWFFIFFDFSLPRNNAIIATVFDITQ